MNLGPEPGTEYQQLALHVMNKMRLYQLSSQADQKLRLKRRAGCSSCGRPSNKGKLRAEGTTAFYTGRPGTLKGL